MKIIHLILHTMLLLSPSITKSQTTLTIQAILVDVANQPLAYSNIGIVGTSIGTISAPDGSFSLYLKEGIDEEQIVRISHLGYQTKDFTVASLLLLNNSTIKLSNEAITLQTVEVRPIGKQSKIVGHNRTSPMRVTNFSISKRPNQNLGAAIGKKFNLGKEEVRLNSFKFFIANNNFETARFRVEVYSLKNGRPDKSLHTQNIITEINGQTKGWIAVDLSPYAMYAKGKIAIAITWIYHSEKGRILQLPLTFPAISSTHYYRYGSQNKWKRFRGMSTAMQLEILQ